MVDKAEVTIADVARYILDQFGQMTTMKLQKLCYYTQAWHLASFKTPLFEADFAAWDNGPVSKELYEVHRGQYSISAQQIAAKEISDTETRTFIDSIVSAYQKFSGDELSSISHLESPWLSAKEQSVRSGNPNVVISKGSMLEYYSNLDSTNSREIQI